LVFVDLGSKRGSKVNHHMCNGRRVLRDGDLIKVGRTRMRVFGTYTHHPPPTQSLPTHHRSLTDHWPAVSPNSTNQQPASRTSTDQ
jgi:pSer/pThr/pTyr-binding forkhead associated (FHA) protein